MDDPVSEIRTVINGLNDPSPSVQRYTIVKYFNPHAAFKSPFCSTAGSRWLMVQVFQWVKILNRKVETSIDSISFDAQTLLLSVLTQQSYTVPVWPCSKVRSFSYLVFKLDYETIANRLNMSPTVEDEPEQNGDGASSSSKKTSKAGGSRAVQKAVKRTAVRKHYIQHACQLYLPTDWVGFNLPWGVGVILAALLEKCVIGTWLLAAFLLQPIGWLHKLLVDGGTV